MRRGVEVADGVVEKNTEYRNRFSSNSVLGRAARLEAFQW